MSLQEEERDTQGENSHGATEEEISVIRLEAKERPQTPEARRGEERFSPTGVFQRERGPACT